MTKSGLFKKYRDSSAMFEKMGSADDLDKVDSFDSSKPTVVPSGGKIGNNRSASVTAMTSHQRTSVQDRVTSSQPEKTQRHSFNVVPTSTANNRSR